LAALKASYKRNRSVNMVVLEEAKDEILMGVSRQTERSVENRKMTAYHEAGHAILAQTLTNDLHKATILSRGRAEGMVNSVLSCLILADSYVT
jgi:cell division protease FtsH